MLARLVAEPSIVDAAIVAKQDGGVVDEALDVALADDVKVVWELGRVPADKNNSYSNEMQQNVERIQISLKTYDLYARSKTVR